MQRLATAVAVSLVAFASGVFTALPAHADVVWSETTHGDLSNNGNAPTPLGTFGPGTHSVLSSSAAGDIDDFTFTVPAGLTLDAIINSNYSGIDETAFIGIASGSTINHATAPTGLLGYAHFGPGQGNEDIDLLPSMIFADTLAPGTYSVWLQQAGSSATTQMDFVVTPEPGSVATLALAALVFTTARRRAAAK